MKNKKQIRSRIDELKTKENEILIEMMNLSYGTFEYRIQYDRLTEVKKRISDLEWVLS